MPGGVKWTIGIPSVPARRKLRERILKQLDKQIEGYSGIELLVLEDNRQRQLGAKRQAIVDIAQGEYISFVDDDDLISDHFIDTICPMLDERDALLVLLKENTGRRPARHATTDPIHVCMLGNPLQYREHVLFEIAPGERSRIASEEVSVLRFAL